MAKANAVSGSTVYVAEGAPVPTELPPQVRLVGPGAPVPTAEAAPAAGEPEPVAATGEPDDGQAPAQPVFTDASLIRPNVNAPKADWVTYAVAADETLGYDGADALTKTELVERYGR